MKSVRILRKDLIIIKNCNNICRKKYSTKKNIDNNQQTKKNNISKN